MLKITYPLVPHIVCDLEHTCDHPRFPCGYGKHEILNDTNKQDRKSDLLVTDSTVNTLTRKIGLLHWLLPAYWLPVPTQEAKCPRRLHSPCNPRCHAVYLTRQVRIELEDNAPLVIDLTSGPSDSSRTSKLVRVRRTCFARFGTPAGPVTRELTIPSRLLLCRKRLTFILLTSLLSSFWLACVFLTDLLYRQ